jgi:hypothetical protein
LVTFNAALKIPVVAAISPPKALPRFDNILEGVGGIGRAHRSGEFEFAKWRPNEFDQQVRFEISSSDSFGFKHDSVIVTEAYR